jgi:murein DD-endopeptidase MepM/ murein hydrolase activator NlpD
VKTSEIRMVVWLFLSVLIALSVLGFANRADLQPTSPVETTPPPSLTTAPPQPGGPPPNPEPTSVAAKPSDPLLGKSASPSPAKLTSEPRDAVRAPIGAETPDPRLQASISPLPGDAPTRPELAPAEPAPESLSGGLTAVKCPLRRVAMVRGSDSEASEGGGFYAARKNGIHGAVDLNGSLGEAVFAVANGKVVTAGDWGKLGKTVILDHLDGGYTTYGHLRTVDVKLNSPVTAGQMLGTIGYSGNAKRLQAKNLPPHLHFAYFRGASPLARIRDTAEGLGASFARDYGVAGATGVLNPTWAVGFHKCWEEPVLARRPS